MRHALGWSGVLAACVLGAGLASLALGQDANWDLRNYHYYVAHALLNGRLGWDLAPAQIQTYLNPIADLPFYALVQLLPGPRSVAFAMALPAALAAFFLLRILTLLFTRGAPQRMLCIVASALIGLTTATGLAELGSTMNEWLGAALVLAGADCALRAVDVRRESTWRPIAVAGLLIGIAAGLKLTNSGFALALGVALLCVGSPQQRLRRTVVAAAAMLVGFAAAYGFWAVEMQQRFGSPLFPFFNGFFKSPWWEMQDWYDTKFGPRGALQALFFPIWYSQHYQSVAEISFRDHRMATLLVVAAMATAITVVRRRPRARFDDPAAGEPWVFIAVFALVSYLAWLAAFSIHRYLLPLEVLSGALIVGCVANGLRKAGARRVVIVVLAVLLVGTTRKAGWERVPFSGEYFAVSTPKVGQEAMVVMAWNLPASYVIPFFPSDARFVSANNNFLVPGQRNLLARQVASAIERHTGPLYLLEARASPEKESALFRLGLGRSGEPCATVRSNLDGDALQVCGLRRAGSAGG